MGEMRKPYPPEFRQQMVGLAWAGRTPGSLSCEFEPTAGSIRNWVRQADRDEGLMSKRVKLHRLQRESSQLEINREILAKGAAGPLCCIVIFFPG